MPKLKQITSLLLLIFIATLPAVATARTWSLDELTLEMGSGMRTAGSVSLTPNDNGQVYFTLPHSGITLEQEHLLTLQFASRPPPVIFIIWRSDTDPQQLFQHRLPPQQENPLVYDLGAVQGWRGKATQLGIGIQLQPSGQTSLQQLSLDSPTILTGIANGWRNWTSFRPWKPVDVNIHTGTRSLGEGPHPMPWFAALALLLLCAYGLWHYLKHRSLQLNWRVAGALVLITWMLSDVFWQLRLWRQVPLTYQQFSGKTAAEKLLASSDADMVRFTTAAKEKIPEKNARVFIASISDSAGMRSAYYMSPLNTYWHRKGPELPSREQLHGDDYILLVSPTSVAYDAGRGKVHFRDGSTLSAEQLLASPQGALLRVVQ